VSETRPCRRCGAPLLFATTGEISPKTGKPVIVPLDARKHPIYRVVGEKDGATVIARVEAMVSHFATCPDADVFSGSKKIAAKGGA